MEVDHAASNQNNSKYQPEAADCDVRRAPRLTGLTAGCAQDHSFFSALLIDIATVAASQIAGNDIYADSHADDCKSC